MLKKIDLRHFIDYILVLVYLRRQKLSFGQQSKVGRVCDYFYHRNHFVRAFSLRLNRSFKRKSRSCQSSLCLNSLTYNFPFYNSIFVLKVSSRNVFAHSFRINFHFFNLRFQAQSNYFFPNKIQFLKDSF